MQSAGNVAVTALPSEQRQYLDGDHKRSRSRQQRKEGLVGYLFILPSIIGFAVFVLYPLITTFYYAMTKWNGITAPEFIGLKNFVRMFTTDPSFIPSLQATLIFTLLSVVSSLVVGLLLAMLLNRNLPGIKLFRTALYLPAILPAIATLTLWKFIYHPQYGLANEVLSALHLPTSAWLGSYQMAIPAMVIIGIWGVGSTMIIFLAGLQAVPQELYEAAKIDGSGTFDLFFRITLPMISPILFLQLILQIITALQAFNQPAVLTQGGPGFSTDLLMYSIYQHAFSGFNANPQMGYASAQVVVLFFLILLVTAFTFRFSSMWVYSDNNLD